MAGGYNPAGGLYMSALIVKKYICAKGAQKFCFIQPAEEQRFVNAHAPGP